MAHWAALIAPALIYFSFQYGKEGHSGWGIPMATDIAFVVGFSPCWQARSAGLKILLLALAIADDIGAVLVIAYSIRRRSPCYRWVFRPSVRVAYLCNRAGGGTRQRVRDHRRGNLAGIFLLGRASDGGGCHAWPHDSWKCLARPYRP